MGEGRQSLDFLELRTKGMPERRLLAGLGEPFNAACVRAAGKSRRDLTLSEKCQDPLTSSSPSRHMTTRQVTSENSTPDSPVAEYSIQFKRSRILSIRDIQGTR